MTRHERAMRSLSWLLGAAPVALFLALTLVTLACMALDSCDREDAMQLERVRADQQVHAQTSANNDAD